jgi:hypothetical protein
MRRLALTLLALALVALCLAFPAVAHAQSAEWGCGGLPAYNLIVASPTRMLMQVEIAVRDKQCLGVAQRVRVGTVTKYRVLWVPCAGQAGWRLGGDSTTMAKAFAAAMKPPLCPPVRSNVPTKVGG